jgi:hypothetical protein
MGMLERRLRLALAPKARDELGVAAQLVRQQLEGDPAATVDRLRRVDGRHAPAAEHTLDPVARYHCPCPKRHVSKAQ